MYDFIISSSLQFVSNYRCGFQSEVLTKEPKNILSDNFNFLQCYDGASIHYVDRTVSLMIFWGREEQSHGKTMLKYDWPLEDPM